MLLISSHQPDRAETERAARQRFLTVYFAVFGALRRNGAPQLGYKDVIYQANCQTGQSPAAAFGWLLKKGALQRKKLLTLIFNSSRESHPSEAARLRAGFFVWRSYRAKCAHRNRRRKSCRFRKAKVVAGPAGRAARATA
ncbi:MAG TPA: hypothetical protein VGH39_07590, partial [Xanthobacteraceae bacterium]